MVKRCLHACQRVHHLSRPRSALEAGDQPLPAALLGEGTLAAFCLAVLDQAIRAHGTFPHAQGERHDPTPAGGLLGPRSGAEPPVGWTALRSAFIEAAY